MGDITESAKGSNAKAIRLNYDYIRDQSADKCLFCLSKQQVMALIASIEPLSWKTRWYSLIGTAIDTDWIDSFYAQLENELMTDHCDLATDITNILTEITNINTTITTINTNITNIQNITNINITQVNQGTYNYEVNYILGQLGNPNCNLPDKSFLTKTTDSQDDRYNRWAALINACVRFIKTICYRMLYVDTPTNTSDLETAWQDLATAGGVVLGLVAFNPLSTFGISFSTLLTAMTDSTAMLNVACTMANALAFNAISFANFSAACSAGAWTAGTDEYYLQVVLAAAEGADVLQYNYNAFLNVLALEFVKAQAIIPVLTSYDYLGCQLGTNLPLTANFLIGDFEGWVVKYGIYEPGNGIRSAHTYDEGSGSTWNVVWVYRDFPSLVNTSSYNLEYLGTTDGEGLTVSTATPINIAEYVPSGGVCPDTLTSYSPIGGVTADGTVKITGPLSASGSGLCRIHVTGYWRYRWYIRKFSVA